MTVTLYEHPFASYCWKARIALYERGVPFESRVVDAEPERARLAELWPMAGMPVLVDSAAGVTLPESTIIIEYLDRLGDAPRLIPAAPAPALQARLWDRVIDGHVMNPMQKIVLDNLRPEGRRDPEGVAQARDTLERAYELLDGHLQGGGWAAGEAFTLADCAAAPALFYARVVHRWHESRLADLTRLLHPARGAPLGRAGHRRGAPVPAPLPAPLARLRRVSALQARQPVSSAAHLRACFASPPAFSTHLA